MNSPQQNRPRQNRPQPDTARLELHYGLDDKPRALRDAVIYSAQWMLIMMYPVVWGYVIVGLGLGFTPQELADYMGRVVLMIGVSSLAQAACGHRFPMATGPNIIPSTAIVAAYLAGGKEYAYLAINAGVICGFLVAALGALGVINLIARVWTPLVMGSMTMMVGLITSTLGMGLIAGSEHSAGLYIGIVLALLCGWLSIKGRGLLATIPVLVAIVLGYVVFIALGRFDWALVDSMPLWSLPRFFPYGLELPPLELLFMMLAAHLFSAIKEFGCVNGYAGLVGRPLTPGRTRRLFTIFGLVDTSLASALGVPATVSYGENMGILLLTKVAARIFIILAGAGFIILSLYGKTGGMMAAMPGPVAGAVLLGVAATLIGLGAETWLRGPRFKTREIFIVGFSIFFAYGLAHVDEHFYTTLPRIMGMVCKNPLITVIICGILLEQIIFREARDSGAHTESDKEARKE